MQRLALLAKGCASRFRASPNFERQFDHDNSRAIAFAALQFCTFFLRELVVDCLAQFCALLLVLGWHYAAGKFSTIYPVQHLPCYLQPLATSALSCLSPTSADRVCIAETCSVATIRCWSLVDCLCSGRARRRCVQAASTVTDRGSSGIDINGSRPTSPRAWEILMQTLQNEQVGARI